MNTVVATPPVYRCRGITKTYGGVAALSEVDVDIAAGEVHALLGANGAGKSTLLKILSGAEQPDDGLLELRGAATHFGSARHAAEAGAATVFQELSLFPDLDVGTNLFIHREPRVAGIISRRRMQARARPVLDEIGLDVPLDMPAGQLALGEQQLVEIARALLQDPEILFLDEPTSALQPAEAERLLAVIDRLRGRGVAIVYVSHFLQEVLRIADVVTVLRDGRTVMRARQIGGLDIDTLVDAMLGDRADSAAVTRFGSGSAAPGGPGADLVVAGLASRGALTNATFGAAPGEVVGLAGLEGSGHDAIFEVLFGLLRADGGTVRMPDGGPCPHSPVAAVRRGVALIPADRKSAGGALEQTLWENIATVGAACLGRLGPVPSRRRMRDRARERMASLAIKAPGPDSRLDQLSGGNQQKVVFAKWLEAEPSLVMADDPTRGVDVGAKPEMYRILRALADEGRVVLVRSSDPAELVEICDRVVVVHHGETVASLTEADLTEARLLRAINGED